MDGLVVRRTDKFGYTRVSEDMETADDAFGRLIHIGDRVVFASAGNPGLRRGVVARIQFKDTFYSLHPNACHYDKIEVTMEDGRKVRAHMVMVEER